MEKKKSRKKEGRKRGARLPEDLEDDDVTTLSDSVKVRTLAVPCHYSRLLQHPVHRDNDQTDQGLMICRYMDEGVVGSGIGLFLIWGPLAEDSATKLKRGQLSVCTVSVYCVWCIFFLPVGVCARLAGNFVTKTRPTKEPGQDLEASGLQNLISQ
jgi:hypothetical protein